VAKDSYRIQERWTVGAVCALGLLIALVSLLIGFAIDQHFPNRTIAQYISFIIRSFGQLIGITGLLAFVSDRFGQISIFRQFSNELTEKMRNLVFEDLANVRAIGIENVQREIKFEELFGNLRPHDELYVLSTYLSQNLHDELLDPAENAAKRGVRLHFLVMNPDSALLSMRVEELIKYELSPDIFKEGIKCFLAELLKRQQRVAKEKNGKTNGFLQIAEYDDLIGSPVYLIRRNGKPVLAYSSFYFDRPIDRGGVPYFKWKDIGKDSFIYQIDSYVMAKWKRWFKKQDESSAA
jgi:ABC-type multidrug transport system fused ATPase/permease subunit